MKPILYGFLIVLLGIAAGCSTTGQMPATESDPSGRWHRDQEGNITSGISKPETTTSLIEQGEGKLPIFVVNTGEEGELHDPLEDMPEFKAAFADAERQADRENAKYRGQPGAIHLFWETKKKVLREKYHIDWKSPPELNSGHYYD